MAVVEWFHFRCSRCPNGSAPAVAGVVVAVLAPRLLLWLPWFNSFAIVATTVVAAVVTVALKRLRSSGSVPPSGGAVVAAALWKLAVAQIGLSL